MAAYTQSGKALIAALVVLLAVCLVLIGALAFMSRDRLGAVYAALTLPAQLSEQGAAPAEPEPEPQAPAAPRPVEQPEPAPLQSAPASPVAAPAAGPVEPGNPVVARIGDAKIRRVEVLEFIESLPDDVREGRSAMEIFPEAVAEMVDTRIVEERVADSRVARSQEVAEEVEKARERIARSAYLRQQVDARMTDERLRRAYTAYAAQAPEVQEMRARHILVPTREEAEAIIAELDKGRSFEALAMAHSIDESAARGGDLGAYFTAAEVVEPFGAAAEALEPGAHSAQPVQTEFGWHVIMVEDRRARALPGFEAAKPQLKEALQREVLMELLDDWRAQADAQIFDINGTPVATEPPVAEPQGQQAGGQSSVLMAPAFSDAE